MAVSGERLRLVFVAVLVALAAQMLFSAMTVHAREFARFLAA
jgi:hypothetical protein